VRSLWNSRSSEMSTSCKVWLTVATVAAAEERVDAMTARRRDKVALCGARVTRIYSSFSTTKSKPVITEHAQRVL